jgi:acetoin utilization deacetylase AcuC-like enzyme
VSKVGFVHDPACAGHDTGQGHPERQARVEAVLQQLRSGGLWTELDVRESEPFPVADLELVHDAEMWERTRRIVDSGGGVLDGGDTVTSPGSWRAALGAAGCARLAVDAVVSSEWSSAFALCRPPGHHAERDRAMGFCLLNNVALAARHLQRAHGLRRVAIVDWDVHHGNGTQHIFEADASVHYTSLHQWPHYPGTGSAEERGIGVGVGTTCNIPMPAGSGDREWLAAIDDIVLPELHEFGPEFLLVSAGFDAHERDPLSATRLTNAGYRAMTDRLVALAHALCGGRIVSVLEGGYDLVGLAGAVDTHLRGLIAGSRGTAGAGSDPVG